MKILDQLNTTQPAQGLMIAWVRYNGRSPNATNAAALRATYGRFFGTSLANLFDELINPVLPGQPPNIHGLEDGLGSALGLFLPPLAVGNGTVRLLRISDVLGRCVPG